MSMKYTQEQKIQIIRSISKRLSEYFTLGYLTEEDICQECFILGWEGLKRYNNKHPLEHFMYVHIRNRFLNLIRNKVRRKDPPCYTCHAAHLEPELFKPDHIDNQFCKKYLMWLERNNTKSLLMHNWSSDEFDLSTKEAAGLSVEFKQEIIDLLNKELTIKNRKILNRYLEKKKISSQLLKDFIEECKKVISKFNVKWESDDADTNT